MRQRSFTKIISCTALILFWSFKYISAQTTMTAIDVLLDPDKAMLDSAKVYNDLMRKNYNGAGSFALDAIHSPHITVLQCFVKTSDLKKIYAAVAEVVKSEKPTEEK